MLTQKTKILVLGGGFGGIKAIRGLANNPAVTITLITNQKTFRYGATLWRTATGHRKRESYIPVAELIGPTQNVTIVYDTAQKIDRQAHTVTTAGGNHYNYDFCIISLGVVTSYFGIKGLEEHSYTIKSNEGLEKLREHLHDELLSERVLDKNYVVVGAGPTGVELSAGLRHYLKVIASHHHLKRTKVNLELIEAAPRVLPSLSPEASTLAVKRLRQLGVRVMTGKQVQGETATSLMVDKRSIPTKTVIWTAGVTNNPFFAANPSQFTLNEKKKVVVDDHLRVDPQVFVIGDNAATPYSGLAMTAIHNGRYVAKLINCELAGKTVPPYTPQKPKIVIPVGEGWAVLETHGFVLSGHLASAIRVVVDLIGYAYIMGGKRAVQLWLGRNKLEEDCPTCKLKTEQQ